MSEDNKNFYTSVIIFIAAMVTLFVVFSGAFQYMQKVMV